MREESSATASVPIVLSARPAGAEGSGLALAAVGVLSFSLSFPATVFALDGLDPYVIGVGRAAVAAILAAIALLSTRAAAARRTARRPRRDQWPGLAAVGLGVVFGFPVLSTLALHDGASASHGAVVIGLLPAATAVLAVLRAHERPSRAFWAASAAGAACVTGFALTRSAGRFSSADLLLFGALLAGAVGYAEGGRLAREMPGWRVISWALVLTAPVSIPVTAVLLAEGHPHWTAKAVIGFGYVSLVSMFVGFFAWYAGLGRAGIARASQTQLAQPLLTLGWSALLLHERLDVTTALAAVAVLTCVAWTQRTRTPIRTGAASAMRSREGAGASSSSRRSIATGHHPAKRNANRM